MIKRLLFVVCLLCPALGVAQSDISLTAAQYWAIDAGGSTPIMKSATAAGSQTACELLVPYTSGSGTQYRMDPIMPIGTGSPVAGPYQTRLCRHQSKSSTSSTWVNSQQWTARRFSCVAPKPYWSEKDKACVADVDPPPDPCGDKNPMVKKYGYGLAVPPYDLPTTFGSCKITVDEVLVCRKETINGVTSTYCMMQVRRTGDPATAIPPSSPRDSSDPQNTSDPKTEMPPSNASDGSGKCPAGSVQGGIDSRGTPICIGTGTNPPTPSQPKPSQNTSTTEATPDGGTKTTNTTTYTNADGSTTTNVTITIKNPDGSTSTSGSSTVGPKPAGGQGVDDKPEDDKFDLCKQNPMLSICRNSSVSGTCGTITCQGDAIQCATLRAAAAMECRDASDREELAQSPLKSSGAAIIAGSDPEKAAIDAAMAGTVVDLSNPNLDVSGFIGGGSCFAPMTISVLGHTVTQSFAEVCENIVPLRYAIMLCASIISYLIVGRTVLGA